VVGVYRIMSLNIAARRLKCEWLGDIFEQTETQRRREKVENPQRYRSIRPMISTPTAPNTVIKTINIGRRGVGEGRDAGQTDDIALYGGKRG